MSQRPKFSSQTTEAPPRPPIAPNSQLPPSRLSALLHSVAWVALAVFLWIYGDVKRVILYDARVNDSFFWLSAFSLSCLVLILFYMSFVLPYQIGPIVDYETACPRVVYAGCGFYSLWFLFSFAAFWPIWGIVTGGFLFVFTIAACLSTNFIPSWGGAKEN